ncbi:MAG: cellulase family glycosylhydrolase [Cellvibrio sp.]|uniref:cellulase family glycosylhydrolase n=1 Tax=Cellvibrio sp. TaxID=1965322 RepID=UPI0031B49912
MTKSIRKISFINLKTSLLSTCILGLVACGGGSDHGVRASTNTPSSTPAVSSSSSSSSVAPVAVCNPVTTGTEGLTMLKTDGAKWVKSNGDQVCLKGTNLGNWLVQEFWMMGQGGNGVHDQCTLEAKLTERFGYSEKERLIKLFRDNWIKERDFDQLKAFGFNVIRLPILWSVIEDEKNPRTLRADAWHYIDWTIAEAKKRGMYVILDLHGALGGQTPNDHTGCSGQNQYWTNAEYQDRTKWLWEQIATKYKDEPAVAAYDPLNEPWGSTAEDMAVRVNELYDTIRKIDDKHIIMLHSHYGSIDVYGDPATTGKTNVAFQLHPYPGLFGDRPSDTHFDIHRDWLKCGNDGKGGVCDWNKRLTTLKTPMLMGEFQPWQGAGAGVDDLGGKIGGATYDIFASYGWASTSWSYKLVTVAGGQGKGTWGMVTNEVNTNLDTGVGLITKASTWDCNNWDSTFANACAKKATTITAGGTGDKTYYLVIKVGANGGANPDVTLDSISLKNATTNEELLANSNFGASGGWSELAISGSLAFNYNSLDATKAPTGSNGPVLHITRPAGVDGEINGAIYQQITLKGGQTYNFSGVFKGNSSVNTWAEIYLIEDAPVAGKDVVDNAGKVDFTTAPVAAIETLFKSYGEVGYDVNAGLAKWLVTDEHNNVFDYPIRPANVKLVQTGNSVALTWDAIAGNGITYNVYRSNLAGNKGALVAEGLTALTFNDSGLNAEETYYYSIAAKNSIAEGYTSEQVNTPLMYQPVPAKIEAEKFTAMSGVQTENSGDTGGGLNVGHFESGDFIEFKIKAETAGNYVIDYRLASQPGSTGFEALIDGVVVDTQTLAATGGWQTYITQTGASFALTEGNHTLRLRSVGKEWNLNWIEIKKQ